MASRPLFSARSCSPQSAGAARWVNEHYPGLKVTRSYCGFSIDALFWAHRAAVDISDLDGSFHCFKSGIGSYAPNDIGQKARLMGCFPARRETADQARKLASLCWHQLWWPGCPAGNLSCYDAPIAQLCSCYNRHIQTKRGEGNMQPRRGSIQSLGQRAHDTRHNGTLSTKHITTGASHRYNDRDSPCQSAGRLVTPTCLSYHYQTEHPSSF
ncbi:hypothetical protein V8C26DRAFT_286268 [Trichoderma gracile]